MPDFLVEELSDKTLEAFRRQAARRGRSLQQEVRVALERLGTLIEDEGEDPIEAARAIKEELRAGGQVFEDSAELVREDRDRSVRAELRAALQGRARRRAVGGAALARALREELRAGGYAYEDGVSLIREDRDR